MSKYGIAVVLICTMLGLGACVHGPHRKSTPASAPFDKEETMEILRKVAYWQIDRDYGKWPVNFWIVGSMFVGMTEYAIATEDEYLLNRIKQHCEGVDWKMGENIYHADYHTIGQTYLMLYEREKNPAMIAGVKERLDFILTHPSDSTLHFASEKRTRWDWCDALFMSPPVWAHLSRISGDSRYLEFMHREFMATTDYLYDPEEHLFYRDDRYFDKREANGAKVFWSRGNGWVFAGLCRILDQMPKDYPQRGRYETLFREMADKIVEILPEDNLWHSSLLDPDSYPSVEASGSGFFLYGLVWGVNRGLLEHNRFLPYIQRVWPALVHCVQEDGKLGYVQEIGADPRQVNADGTGLYGVGAFLLAGLEIDRLSN